MIIFKIEQVDDDDDYDEKWRKRQGNLLGRCSMSMMKDTVYYELNVARVVGSLNGNIAPSVLSGDVEKNLSENRK